MKNLFLLSVLFVGSLAQAQTVEDAVKSGQIVKLTSLADLSAAVKLGQELIIAVDVEKTTPESEKSLATFAEIAKANIGKWTIVTANEEELKAAKSSLAGRLNPTAANVELLVSTAKSQQSGMGVLQGDETVEDITSAIYVIRAGLSDEGTPAESQSGPAASANSDLDKVIVGAKSKVDLSKISFNGIYEPKSDDELAAILADSKNVPVVIDYSGANAGVAKNSEEMEKLTWCPPCRDFHPIFEAVAKAYKGKVRFIQVRVHHDWKVSEPAIGMKLFAAFGGQGVPTVRLYKDGTSASSEIDASAVEAVFTVIVTRATGINP